MMKKFFPGPPDVQEPETMKIFGPASTQRGTTTFFSTPGVPTCPQWFHPETVSMGPVWGVDPDSVLRVHWLQKPPCAVIAVPSIHAPAD